MPILKKLYKGFSTRNYAEFGGKLDIYNKDVVNEDIMNNLLTKQGERYNMPDWGTRDWNFELNDTDTASVLEGDIREVIKNEPRVSLMNLDIVAQPDKYKLIAIVRIHYLELNIVDDINIEFP